jgi:hypothetical protein
MSEMAVQNSDKKARAQALVQTSASKKIECKSESVLELRSYHIARLSLVYECFVVIN